MDLTERQLNILKAIVKDYVETAEAVGSRTISKKYDFGISAATIRNEMSDLEDMGYLVQPHTSAGRIPTKKGYMLYVDSLMGNRELEENEKEMLRKCVENNFNRVDDLLDELSKILSSITNYTTVAVYDRNRGLRTIKHIQLVSLSPEKILLILVADNGEIKSREFDTFVELPQAKLNVISNSLSNKLSGKKFSELDEEMVAYIKYEIGEYSEIVDDLVYLLNADSDYKISMNGATNIFNYPEFSDMVKAKSFLNMLEERESLAKMIRTKGIQKDNLNIVIGNGDDVSTDLSIITATYNVQDDLQGKISFIGPTRMDYSKVYSILNYMSMLLDGK
ncbi:heat-inducible transcriptional repressor HrcA [Peptostreptococcus sp.]|uniref:heat-inducible transcriptional repressor HrcA n=1 Tax=Peptostreptococcus sp. TaxID=1262 RepID=UPI001CAB3E7C|nr:heat-inducible transcriptional repressor HrcA [Peptostreptococcus sp.]MBF1045698.1 heat-inducible transcription repressor HrcA [Peptostreptococcus sp.]MBF1048641.1 heat-inducible transcription repressor HrcA [Peptostreptococcus sp.]MBF1049304.1 heat-inducible transcription repressor HrcA [Peptostreptococcus sp.]MBF1052407.1 heat-inducible transcription repressor HrcA [Peptostreptococcus sp.]